MDQDNSKQLSNVIKIDESEVQRHVGEIVRGTVEETLSYYSFPQEHWRRIRTNYPLERINPEIRRRTKAVGCFPDGQSALMLVAARLRHIAGTKWGTKKYMDISLLNKQRIEGEHAAPAGNTPLAKKEKAT